MLLMPARGSHKHNLWRSILKNVSPVAIPQPPKATTAYTRVFEADQQWMNHEPIWDATKGHGRPKQKVSCLMISLLDNAPKKQSRHFAFVSFSDF
jgi:hypothetical protein